MLDWFIHSDLAVKFVLEYSLISAIFIVILHKYQKKKKELKIFIGICITILFVMMFVLRYLEDPMFLHNFE